MKVGFWQFLTVTGLILFFFWPLIVRIVRFLSQSRREGRARAGVEHRRPASFRCPKCGELLAANAKFCSRCGCSVDYVDV